MTETILEVKDLTKIYDDRPVVDGISFNVKKGEVFGILGPNGAGKTTLAVPLAAHVQYPLFSKDFSPRYPASGCPG